MVVLSVIVSCWCLPLRLPCRPSVVLCANYTSLGFHFNGNTAEHQNPGAQDMPTFLQCTFQLSPAARLSWQLTAHRIGVRPLHSACPCMMRLWKLCTHTNHMLLHMWPKLVTPHFMGHVMRGIMRYVSAMPSNLVSSALHAAVQLCLCCRSLKLATLQCLV